MEKSFVKFDDVVMAANRHAEIVDKKRRSQQEKSDEEKRSLIRMMAEELKKQIPTTTEVRKIEDNPSGEGGNPQNRRLTPYSRQQFQPRRNFSQRGLKNWNVQQPSRTPDGRPICWICQKPGHLQNACWRNPKNQGNPPFQNRQQNFRQPNFQNRQPNFQNRQPSFQNRQVFRNNFTEDANPPVNQN